MSLVHALAAIGITCLVVGVVWEIAAQRRQCPCGCGNTPNKHNPLRRH